MKTLVNLACAAAVVLSFEPAMAMPAQIGPPSAAPANLVRVSSIGEPYAATTRHRRYAHHGVRHLGSSPLFDNGNGGYRVNRYGYGNYHGGPSGGFAGYPAGSAGAKIYRQQQEWKCQDVPEEC